MKEGFGDLERSCPVKNERSSVVKYSSSISEEVYSPEKRASIPRGRPCTRGARSSTPRGKAISAEEASTPSSSRRDFSTPGGNDVLPEEVELYYSGRRRGRPRRCQSTGIDTDSRRGGVAGRRGNSRGRFSSGAGRGRGTLPSEATKPLQEGFAALRRATGNKTLPDTGNDK